MCNLFQSHFPARNQQQSGNALERRTVESKQISTISSLVKGSNGECDDGNKQLHDIQKENFGLYALKYSRSSASKRGTFQSEKGAARPMSVENRNHEHFQPCRATSIDSNDSQRSVCHDEGGYVEVNFSDDSNSDVIPASRMKVVRPKLKVPPPPVPPKRGKANTKPKHRQQKLYAPPEAQCNDGRFTERSLHSQRNKLTGSRFVVSRVNDIQSDPINRTRIKSELHRIAATKERTIASATIEQYPQSSPPRPPTANVSTTRRLQRHNQSSVKSIDIFQPTNQSDAFDDFDEVLQVAPVVVVDDYSGDVNHNKATRAIHPVAHRRHSRGSSDLPKVIRDSNANGDYSNKTWNISTDSNEIKIYSREKLPGDSDDEIIV